MVLANGSQGPGLIAFRNMFYVNCLKPLRFINFLRTNLPRRRGRTQVGLPQRGRTQLLTAYQLLQ